MAQSKRKTARKTTKTTASKTTAKKTTRKATATTAEAEGTQQVVRVEPGGIDPRLVEQRERQREAEQGVSFASAAAPASLDPKLAEIREKTKAEELRLANRDLTQPPERTRR